MRRYRRQEDGFTFVEALLQLVLLVVFGQLLFLIFIEYQEMNDIKKKRLEADWEICVNDINQSLPYGKSKITVSQGGLSITVRTPDKVYNIQFLNKVLWKRENNGNETLLTGVKSANFELNDNRLLLKVKLEDGKERERIFIVEQHSE